MTWIGWLIDLTVSQAGTRPAAPINTHPVNEFDPQVPNPNYCSIV